MRLSLQCDATSTEQTSSSYTSPGKEPLLSLRSQSDLAVHLGGSRANTEPLVNATSERMKYEEVWANGASRRRSSSGSSCENDLNNDAPSTVPKHDGAEDDASAACGKSLESGGCGPIEQCSACDRDLTAYRCVCLCDHHETEQVFCKDCMHTCPPEHVHLLVRNQRPLSTEECIRFDFLRSFGGEATCLMLWTVILINGPKYCILHTNTNISAILISEY